MTPYRRSKIRPLTLKEKPAYRLRKKAPLKKVKYHPTTEITVTDTVESMILTAANIQARNYVLIHLHSARSMKRVGVAGT